MAYCRPFKRGVSWRSQNFGDNPNNGTNGAGGHTGNDDAAPIGSEVHAAGDGVVEYAGQFDDTYADNLLWLIDFGGDILVLNCGDSEPTFVYAHLSRFLVKPGDRVRKGQVIALSGNSGTRTTGPHCHNEAIAPGYVLNSPTLGRVNPDLYLTEWPDDLTGLAAMGGTITPLEQQEDELSAEFERDVRAQLEKDAGQFAKFDRDVRAQLQSLPNFERDVRADLAQKAAQITALTSTAEALAGIVGREQGLDVEQIKQAVTEAIAAGIKITVEAGK